MKVLKTLIITLAAVCVLTASTPSKAAIGLALGSPITVIAGVVVAAGGAVTVLTAEKSPDVVTAILKYFGGIGALIGGLVVLDGEAGQFLEFSPLTSSEAKGLGLTSIEAAAFNAELDQLNAMASYVDGEVSRMIDPSANDAANVWNDVKSSVSPEAFGALAKVSKQLVR